jgi:hypothetical protein
MLTSMETRQDSYRFRLTVELAAAHKSGFVLDTVRAQQQRWSTERCTPSATPSCTTSTAASTKSSWRAAATPPSPTSLHRVDPSTGAHSNATAPLRYIEHVRLADLLLTGKRDEASDYLREHLSSSSQEKTNPSGH